MTRLRIFDAFPSSLLRGYAVTRRRGLRVAGERGRVFTTLNAETTLHRPYYSSTPARNAHYFCSSAFALRTSPLVVTVLGPL